jgi:hypothetical protein
LTAVPKSTEMTGPPTRSNAGHGVDEPVGAELARVVDADRHPGADPGPHRPHVVGQVPPAHLEPLGLERRHGARDDRAREVGEPDAAQLEEVQQRRAELVGGGPA